MEQDLLTSLPEELIMDILSRLPIPSIIQSKLVCKPWIDLIESHEFAKVHLSKSVPGLALGRSEAYEFLEFVEELDGHKRSDHCNAVFNFRLPYNGPILCSVNGLLFMHQDLIICNPITRDYIVLPLPESYNSDHSGKSKTTYGFGVSKISRQYKLVMISQYWDDESSSSSAPVPPKCEVYTLGTGSWRSIVGCPSTIKYDGEGDEFGVFFNGNLHWRGRGDDGEEHRICCFDLETERFSTFYSPPTDIYGRLNALEDCLCLCDNFVLGVHGFDVWSLNGISIWSLEEYGDEKSWTKKHECLVWGFYFPIKVFKDGDILMSGEGSYGEFLYSDKSRSIIEVGVDSELVCFSDNKASKVIYTPTFLSLKTFARDNVSLY